MYSSPRTDVCFESRVRLLLHDDTLSLTYTVENVHTSLLPAITTFQQ